MIDLHSHILPGVDDGARTIDDARAMARAAARDGVTAVAATPHVRSDYPTTAEAMEQGVDALRRDFASEGIAVDVLHGAEVELERVSALGDDERARLTLAQTGRYLMLEFPYYGWPLALETTVFELRTAGITAVLAHPERNVDVQESPARLEQAVAGGAVVQLTAASLDGRLGRGPRATGARLLELGLAHLIASDSHMPEIRETGLAAAARAVGDAGLARYLTVDTPAAIVAGEPVAPAAPRRRRRVPFGRR